MNLTDAITALESGVKEALELALREILRAAATDDLTPLGNAIGLRGASSLIGTGEGQYDVVVFADLDGLKSLNDRHGHVVGDAAISHVGGLIDRLFVKGCGARAFRRSGDEFVILVSSGSLDAFNEHVPSFAVCSFPLNDETFVTSASFGYAVREGETTFEELLSRAEVACTNLAKAQGGGRCIQWSRDLEQRYVSTLRGRCSDCGASFICDVPQSNRPTDGRLVACPCCGRRLS